MIDSNEVRGNVEKRVTLSNSRSITVIVCVKPTKVVVLQ